MFVREIDYVAEAKVLFSEAAEVAVDALLFLHALPLVVFCRVHLF